jgi:hypothetical protein
MYLWSDLQQGRLRTTGRSGSLLGSLPNGAGCLASSFVPRACAVQTRCNASECLNGRHGSHPDPEAIAHAWQHAARYGRMA